MTLPFIGMQQHLVWQIGLALIWIFTILLLALNHFSQASPKMARHRPLLDFLTHLTFLRQIIYLLSAFWRDDHLIRLNSDFHCNLTWWREVFHSWDSFSFLLSSQWAPLPDFHISSVATGAGGYGAIFNDQWFVGEWSSAQQPLSITYKEFFPLVVAAYLWGHVWVSKRVEFCSHKLWLWSVSCARARPGILTWWFFFVTCCHL